MNIFVYSRVLTLRGNYIPLSQPLITGFVVQSRSLKSSQLKHLYLSVCSLPSLYTIFFFFNCFLELNLFGHFKVNFKVSLAVRESGGTVPQWRAAEMKLRLASRTRVLIQRSLWRRAQWAGTSPNCVAETRAGTLLIWELRGLGCTVIVCLMRD